MKSYYYLWLLAIGISVSGTSCTRNDEIGQGQSSVILEEEIQGTFSNSTLPSGVTVTSVAGDIADLPNPDLSFCSSKSVSLCTENDGNLGNLIVRTGSDNKVYVTYSISTTNWFIRNLCLYVGSDNNLPKTSYGTVNLFAFPIIKSFYAPYNVKKYTFILSGISGTPTVAAFADVVRFTYNRIREQKSLWADGCTGTKIYQGGNIYTCGGNDGNGYSMTWATKLVYAVQQCMTPPPPPVMTEEPEICSNAAPVFFDNDYVVAWRDINGGDSISNGHVTHGGKNYRESEGRAIHLSQAPNTSADAKNAFEQLTALKLSGTDYSLWPPLNNSVNTIETWLQSISKLNPGYLPAPPQTVKDATLFIETWINDHPCPDRR